MNKKWMKCGVAALLLLAGCEKSGNNASQTAPSTNNPAGSTTANQAAPGQVESQQNAPAPGPFVVPAGTVLPVILSSTINSYKNSPGDEFEGSLAAPVMINGEEAVPKGAIVRGTVVDAKKQGAVKGEAILSVRLRGIRVRGKDYLISSSTYAAAEKGKGKRSAVMTGGGAAVGALIGGLAGGGKGAAIGAAAGGGGGLAASAGTGGKNVEFPAESRITFKLEKEVIIDR